MIDALRDQYNAAELAWRAAVDRLRDDRSDAARATERGALAEVERLHVEYGRAKRRAYRIAVLGGTDDALAAAIEQIRDRLDALEAP